jgi:hypothetical protein
MGRIHERTEANRIRTKPSRPVDGVEVLHHPDSWEWSFIGPDGAQVYCGSWGEAAQRIGELDAVGTWRAAGHVERLRPPTHESETTSALPTPTTAPTGQRTASIDRMADPASIRELVEITGGSVARPTRVRLLVSEAVIEVPTVAVALRRWDGTVPTSFRRVPNKIPVSSLDRATYPELAIVDLFTAAGWEARWRKNFGGADWWSALGWSSPLSADARLIIGSIDSRVGSLAVRAGRESHGGGIWDLLFWKGTKIGFAEVKQSGEGVTETQAIWLEAALEAGVPIELFSVLRYRVL